jgi:membrane protease YdiL (CAAX protease family)
MSTLAETPAPPVTEPVPDTSGEKIFLAVVAAWALIGMIVLVRRYAVHRPSMIAGHDRLPPVGKQWPLWVGFVAVLTAWIVVSIFCELLIMSARVASGASQPVATSEPYYSNSELAVLSVVGPTGAFLIALGVLPLFQRGALRWMGLGFRDLQSGVKWGALAILVVLPWMFLVQYGIISLYQAVQYKHPSEHDLLRVMKQGSQATKWLAVVGAVLVAPVFEELLFRGLLQTAITEWLTRLSRPKPAIASYGFPVMQQNPSAVPQEMAVQLPQMDLANGPSHVLFAPPPPDAGATSLVTPDHAQVLYAPPTDDTGQQIAVDDVGAHPRTLSPGRHRAAWIAIIVTAGLFSIIHPLWTAPIIFALAVALGYIYERTGNLWASITVHALFNATSTLLVLIGVE